MKLSKSNRAIIYAYKRGYRSDDYGNIFGPKGNKLSLCKGSNGYLIFRIWKNGGYATVPAHRFSAYCYFGDELFINECVRHRDGNKTNNSRKNISLGSLSDNYQDNPKEWRKSFALKGASTRRKLTPECVKKIRQLLKNGETYNRIASEFNVSKSTIQQIKEGRTYRWVK